MVKYADDLRRVLFPESAGLTTMPPPGRVRGRVRRIIGSFPVALGEIQGAAAGRWVLARLASSDVICSIKMAFTAGMDAFATFDLGLYTIAGVVIDADVYATLVGINLGQPSLLEYKYEAGADPAKVGRQVWQDGGEASDPQAERDLCLTWVPFAQAAAGTWAYDIEIASA